MNVGKPAFARDGVHALLPSRAGVRLVCTWFLLSRLAIYLVGVVGATTFVHQRTLSPAHQEAINPAVIWHQWDSIWYEQIAQHGYAPGPGAPSVEAAAFFPLYPAIVGVLLKAAPVASFFWIAALVSNACSLLSLLLIARMVEARGGIDAVNRVLLVMLTAAGSFYLSIPYAEGLLLLLIVVTMLLADRSEYRTSAVAAGLGAVTKPHGVALILMPLLAFVRQGGGSSDFRRMGRVMTIAGIAVVPVAAYLFFLTRATGSPLAFVESQVAWGNPIPYPLKAFVGLVRFPNWLSGWLHGGVWVLYAGLLLRYRRRLSLEHWLFCAGVLLVSTMQESFHGTYRYAILLVPLLQAIAEDEDERIRFSIVAFNLVLGAIMIVAFVTHNRLVV